jgi:hypothetical protein
MAKDSDIPITQAPNRKSLFYMVLRHFFGPPIIQAPKRKSGANKEMWPNSSFLMRTRAVGVCSLTPSSFSLLECRLAAVPESKIPPEVGTPTEGRPTNSCRLPESVG